jgi:Protein of unknown function (DUF1064)
MPERMTAEAFKAATKARKNGKKRVMGAQPTVIDGARFDNRREAKRWQELVLLQRSGAIRDLRRQVRITLEGRDTTLLTPTGKAMSYIADFTYFDVKAGVEVIEDAKGHPTDTYQMKRAILAAMGAELREV